MDQIKIIEKSIQLDGFAISMQIDLQASVFATQSSSLRRFVDFAFAVGSVHLKTHQLDIVLLAEDESGNLIELLRDWEKKFQSLSSIPAGLDVAPKKLASWMLGYWSRLCSDESEVSDESIYAMIESKFILANNDSYVAAYVDGSGSPIVEVATLDSNREALDFCSVFNPSLISSSCKDVRGELEALIR